MPGIFDIKSQMTFYGAYHTNKWNQLVHMIFVPLIMWTALVWLSYTGPLLKLDPSLTASLPPFIQNNLILNAGFFAALFYGVYYLCLDFVVALSYNVLLCGMFLSANAFHAAFPQHAWIYALVLHILSWYFQVSIGHLLFEKRKPSLLDSFFQSLVLAPLFVYLELLFWLGFRSEFRKQLQVEIDKKVKELDAGAKKTK